MMIFFNSIEQSLIYIPLILGVYISFKVLKLTDLTADGSFVLGAGIFSRLLSDGVPYGLCLPAALAGGFSVGLVLAFIQKRDRVPSIVASILCVFMLYSVNLLIMGRPNISLLSVSYFFNVMEDSGSFLPRLFIGGAALFMVVSLMILMQSKYGLLCRAFGSNYALMERLRYSPERIRSLGLGMSNMCYASSGILYAHVQGFADINMGMGVALIGIGAVIIGLQLFAHFNLLREAYFRANREILACLFGIFFYFFAINCLLIFHVDPLYLKMMLGIFLTTIFVTRMKGLKNVSFA